MNAPIKLSLSQAQVAAIKREAIRERPYAGRISLAFALELIDRFATRKDYWPILD